MSIKLNLYVFLFLGLFVITNQIEIYALTMVFALIHELGHLVVGTLLGFRAEAMRIMPLGFCIEFKLDVENYNRKIKKSNILALKKILISFAGPLVNFLIVIVGILYKLESNMIYSNLLIMLFNLIPIYPLDGGRILKNTFKIFFGNKKASKYINLISNIFMIILTIISSVIILVYENLSIFLLIILLWGFVIKENKRYNTYNKIYKTIDKTYNYL